MLNECSVCAVVQELEFERAQPEAAVFPEQDVAAVEVRQQPAAVEETVGEEAEMAEEDEWKATDEF